MSFVKFEYIYFIVPIICVLGYLLIRFYSNSYKFVELYWFYTPKRRYLLSRLFFAVAMILLAISLLDLRGKEEVVEAEVPELRTIILIDTSASMLAEDIKPNRFQRAIFMARHFVKQAIGHQISIVLFSDIQKKIVPFTDDTDLLDARLDGLKTLDISEGGTNLSQALVESVQYLRVESGKSGNISGSIVIFTDAEPHDKEFQVNLDEGVSVSLVAVGTAKGAQIPLRNERGIFQGYKRVNNEPVITKIDDNYLKSLGQGIKNYRYWVSSSYSMPTDEVLSFIHDAINAKTSTSDLRTRPVLSKYILIPALLMYVISTIFSFGRNWKPLSVIILSLYIMSTPNSLMASEEKEVQISTETEAMLQEHLNGNLNDKGILKLGQMLLKDGKVDEGAVLYEEILSNKKIIDEISMFNWATSKLLTKNYIEAVEIYLKLYKQLEALPNTEAREKLKGFVRSNLLLATQQQQEEQQQQQQENQDNKEGDDKQDQKQQDQSGKQDQNKQDQKDQQDQKNDKGNDQQDQNDNSNNNQGNQESPQSVEEYQEMVKNLKKQTKVPAVIKQIMSDDRSLQEKHIDTKTESPQMNQKRDW
jgi:Ca-activated chloride channel family protein